MLRPLIEGVWCDGFGAIIYNLCLHGGTGHAAIGTKNTAITFCGPEPLSTAGTDVKELAGIAWHRQLVLKSTFWAGEYGLSHLIHRWPSLLISDLPSMFWQLTDRS
jgi:hypothetical protein